MPRLRELLASIGVATEIELVEVPDADAADRKRFLASPTVRINGQDVEPRRRSAQRLRPQVPTVRNPEGLRGTRPNNWVVAALQRAQVAAH